MTIQPARLDQAKAIQALVRRSAEAGDMLPRPLGEIYEFLRDFVVAVEDSSGEVIGCCALHITWDDLAEVRSLCVEDANRRAGLGRRLVEACITEARRLGIRRVFALTYVPEFFKKLGFSDIPKDSLPHKVWSDCIKCHKFPDCDEQAVALDITPE
jgi:amino-acid N-acetyltransferase